jgi:two-component system sensor histidine kinase PilS (NtrC family)
MNTSTPEHSWFGPLPSIDSEASEDPQEFARLWQGFMTARLTLGLVLMVLQGALYVTGASHSKTLVTLCVFYFAGTLATRLLAEPKPLGGAFNRTWGVLVGVDVLVFSFLQLLQGNSINYTPLFALPILLASVLGSLRLALGTAAGVTVLLLGGTLWNFVQSGGEATAYFIQAALSGVGYFVIAFLANQLSSRLAREGQRARANQLAANIQRQVNALVIESLPDGVLIVDDKGSVRAANPAARQMLGAQSPQRAAGFDLRDEKGWLPLLQLTRLSVGTGHNQEEDVTISHEGHGPRRLLARTRLAIPMGTGGQSLCVLFLQDQRELEARMRTEKLASMGRMSTAVAHEIRNPLAAIAQANALLDEDISAPHLQRLTQMIGQNAKRLEKIVDDILQVSRVHPHEKAQQSHAIDLGATASQICSEWAQQSGCHQRLLTQGPNERVWVRFDTEHLRRILINLLDNAMRYASAKPQSIQVQCGLSPELQPTLTVWSDGAPMDQSVERHLFEPFFSSESRSSGLGLFICRELCATHGATLIYQRTERRSQDATAVQGNEFATTFQRSEPNPNALLRDNAAIPWQATLH